MSNKADNLVKFKKLTSQQRIEIENIKRKNRPSDLYLRKLRGLVMKGKTVKQAMKILN